MDITLRGLAKRFGREEVLCGIDLDLRPGRITAVIGLNGAGKTTLMRCLAGVIVPTSGSILWNASSSIRDDLDLHRQMLFLPDTPLVMGERTILEHVVLHLRAYARDQSITDDAIITLLNDFDLLPQCRKSLDELSRGQRYKATLAALLLICPEFWLLDEPFASGMDPQAMQLLKQRARSAASAGASIVYTTQVIEIAERFCDDLVVMDHGRISQRFTSDELRAMPSEGPNSLGERLMPFRERR